MLFLFHLFSPEHWNWRPEFTPDIPLSPILIWLGRVVLLYIGAYIIFLLQAPIDALMRFLFF